MATEVAAATAAAAEPISGDLSGTDIGEGTRSSNFCRPSGPAWGVSSIPLEMIEFSAFWEAPLESLVSLSSSSSSSDDEQFDLTSACAWMKKKTK